ncbi:TerB family tellurite resistance protein, partial [Candidatus Pelagibacter sp.]|nr:TerB family tellurite resistance protein [Candidatus Pelagibacter sp.]
MLDFTKEIKNLEDADKIKILKSLWKIIYSNKDADIYETNLMRRLAGLLYIDS